MLPQVTSVLSSESEFSRADFFDPWRFLDENRQIRKDEADKVVAFSLGRRQCAGEALGRMEVAAPPQTGSRSFSSSAASSSDGNFRRNNRWTQRRCSEFCRVRNPSSVTSRRDEYKDRSAESNRVHTADTATQRAHPEKVLRFSDIKNLKLSTAATQRVLSCGQRAPLMVLAISRVISRVRFPESRFRNRPISADLWSSRCGASRRR